VERRFDRRLWVLLTVVPCAFLAIDRFANDDENGGARPEAGARGALRAAALEPVGEATLAVGGRRRVVAEVPAAQWRVRFDRQAQPATAAELAAELAAVRELGSMPKLRAVAAGSNDARVRIAAARRMAERFGPRARGTLAEIARCADETDKVRKQAARLIGRTGPDAETELQALLESDSPVAVRAGAVLGLGELRTASGARAVLHHAAGADSGLRTAANRALARISGPEAAPVLMEAAVDAGYPAAARAAACRGLSWSRDAGTAAALARVLSDGGNPPAVRAAAADALGRLGRPEALAAVRAAAADESPAVARQARIAASRLSR